MEVYDIIISISSVVIAVGVIASFFGDNASKLIHKLASKIKIEVMQRKYPDSDVARGFSFNDKIHLVILRIEILQLIHNTPKKVTIIMDRYEEYQSAGGNSYIDAVYQEWLKDYGQAVIKQRVNKRGAK